MTKLGRALLSLFSGRRDGGDGSRDAWRREWTHAIDAEDVSLLEPLRRQLDTLNAPGEDVEVELEMLDGLEQLGTLLAAESLPIVETQHRVVAGDVCHFTAPASLPDDPAQASGRVLFTASKSIFVGGSRPQPVPWHSLREVIRSDRDVLFVRADGSALAHFRFNTYADAVVAAHLARRLRAGKGTRVL
jgi:hypothetical protein